MGEALSSSIQTELKHQFSIEGGQLCTLRNFIADDVSAVLKVEKAANPYPWSEKNFLDSVECSHICVVAEVSGVFVGHAVFSIASGEAELLILSVDPNWQGRGIAKAVLSYMIQELEDYVAEMFLEVRESNEKAIGLYESLGFNSVGTRPAYYPRGKARENALIYARSLRIA